MYWSKSLRSVNAGRAQGGVKAHNGASLPQPGLDSSPLPVKQCDRASEPPGLGPAVRVDCVSSQFASHASRAYTRSS
jgi:hypothetical protein